MLIENFERAEKIVAQMRELHSIKVDLVNVAQTDITKFPEETNIVFYGWSHGRQNRTMATLYGQSEIRNELLEDAIHLIEDKISDLENELENLP